MPANLKLIGNPLLVLPGVIPLLAITRNAMTTHRNSSSAVFWYFASDPNCNGLRSATTAPIGTSPVEVKRKNKSRKRCIELDPERYRCRSESK